MFYDTGSLLLKSVNYGSKKFYNIVGSFHMVVNRLIDEFTDEFDLTDEMRSGWKCYKIFFLTDGAS
jgi:hypothetical protein